MSDSATLVAPGSTAKHRSLNRRRTLAGLVVVGAALASPPALAVDGCRLMLCLAAPAWRQIQECVPTVVQALRDLARGKAFPTCNMAGASNSAALTWASAPSNCPPQYTRSYDTENTTIYRCDYDGVISVSIDGALFSRTWWNMGGDSVTEFTPRAKAVLKTWDTRFDDDYAVWFSSQPPVQPTESTGGL